MGQNIKVARLSRSLTMEMVAARAEISMATYQRIEQGDPTVAFGLYAMVLFALGAGDRIGMLLESSTDEVGQILLQERLPKRVRIPKRREGDAV